MKYSLVICAVYFIFLFGNNRSHLKAPCLQSETSPASFAQMLQHLGTFTITFVSLHCIVLCVFFFFFFFLNTNCKTFKTMIRKHLLQDRPPAHDLGYSKSRPLSKPWGPKTVLTWTPYKPLLHWGALVEASDLLAPDMGIEAVHRGESLARNAGLLLHTGF